MTATVQHNQSLLDIALQHCGTLEAAVGIAQLNGLSLTQDLEPGQQLALPAVTDRQTVARFAAAKHSPATAITQPDAITAIESGEGIDFWTLETDFTVA